MSILFAALIFATCAVVGWRLGFLIGRRFFVRSIRKEVSKLDPWELGWTHNYYASGRAKQKWIGDAYIKATTDELKKRGVA